MNPRKPSPAQLRADVIKMVMATVKFEDVLFCWERDEPINPWPEGTWRWVCSVPSARQDIYVSDDNAIMCWRMENATRIAAHPSSPAVDPDRPNEPLWLTDEGESYWGDPETFGPPQQ